MKRKKNKFKLKAMMMRNVNKKLIKFVFHEENKPKNLLQPKNNQATLSQMMMREINLWQQNLGSEPSKNRLVSSTKALEKHFQLILKSNSLTDTELKTVVTTCVTSTEMLLPIILQVLEFSWIPKTDHNPFSIITPMTLSVFTSIKKIEE